MGKENSKCGCCSSKENNEVKLDIIKEQISIDSNENNKNLKNSLWNKRFKIICKFKK